MSTAVRFSRLCATSLRSGVEFSRHLLVVAGSLTLGGCATATSDTSAQPVPSSDVSGTEPADGAATVSGPGAADQSANSAATTVGGSKAILVELFSSQGCDSCPEADAFLGEFDQRGWTADKVVKLTYHVTYWDDLGWKDPYASQLFDMRQVSYSQLLPAATAVGKSDNVNEAAGETTVGGPYTPMMVVDGRSHFSGALKDVAAQQISQAQTNAAAVRLDVVAKWTAPQSAEGTASVVVDVESTNLVQGMDTNRSKIGLYAVLSQNALQTAVPYGENKGATLDEFSVVRAFSGPQLYRSYKEKNTTNFSLAAPKGLVASDFTVVVFAQDLANQAVLGVTQVTIAP